MSSPKVGSANNRRTEHVSELRYIALGRIRRQNLVRHERSELRRVTSSTILFSALFCDINSVLFASMRSGARRAACANRRATSASEILVCILLSSPMVLSADFNQPLIESARGRWRSAGRLANFALAFYAASCRKRHLALVCTGG